MPRLDLKALPRISGSGYPPPHTLKVVGRSRLDLAVAGELTQFGANLVTMEPGAWSSQRHWHSAEDEMVVMLSGELVLVEERAEAVLRPGDIATFPASAANGHHLQNRSASAATFLAIGTNFPEVDVCTYPDIGMTLDSAGYHFADQNS